MGGRAAEVHIKTDGDAYNIVSPTTRSYNSPT